MVQKRPYGEEDLYEVSSKQPRQLEPSQQQVSQFEFPCELVDWKTHISGEGSGSRPKIKPEYDEKLNTTNFSHFPLCNVKDVQTCVPESASNSSWATSSTSEEDISAEAPDLVLLSPAYDDHDYPTSARVHSGEIYSTLLKYPPRKLVPVGKDFQAELPEWEAQDRMERHNASDLSSQAQELGFILHCDDEDYFVGTCVIPMPQCEPSAYSEKVGNGRIECSCEDGGSVRCVQQHIAESREKLRETLGQETLVKLGFSGMGEVVAERWSEEEELLFHEIVFSNPASLRRKFWDHLKVEFPSRSMGDIVSYYFNVFMLRKRAEQNRVDQLNIDSDNDEWPGAEDSSDEDDDSVVESPKYEVDPGCNETFEDDIQEDDEDVRDGILEDHQYVHNCCIKSFSDVLDESRDNCNFCPSFQPQDGFFSNETVEQDVQDGSCTSDEGGVAPATYLMKADYQKHWTDSICSGSNTLDILLGPSNAKEWDAGYLSCPQKDAEFLPTCSMIEEVFGAGAWDYDSRDAQGLG